MSTKVAGKWLALVLAMVMVLLAGCARKTEEAKPTEPEIVKGGTLRITYSSDPTSLDVHLTPSVGLVHSLIYDTLVVFGPDRQYHGHLAESWEVGAGGREITFYLRKGVTFHDGTEFDAEAVKFNFDRLANPDLASPGATWLGPYERTEVIDKYTVKVIFKEPYSPFLYSLSTEFLAIQSPAAIQKYGDDYGQKAAVGTGPFMFEAWEAGDRITLVRNPNYKWPPFWYENKGPAYFEKVIFYNMPDEMTRLLALENAEIDIVGIPTHAVEDMKAKPNVEVYEAETSSVVYLGINSSKAPWSDARLRQAVAHIVDREEIVNVALNGMGVPNPTPISTAVFGYEPSLIEEVVYPRDIERAKTLLAEAGYRDTDGDGWVDKDGKPLVLEIMTYNSDPYPRLAEVVREQIIKAGIKVKIKTLESATLLAATPKGEHDAILIAYGWSDPDILYYFFHSSRLDRTNRVHYVNPQVDQLLEKARTVVDADERFAIYRQIQSIIIRDAPWIPLYTPIACTGVRAEVKGFKLGPRGAYWLHDAYKEVPATK